MELRRRRLRAQHRVSRPVGGLHSSEDRATATAPRHEMIRSRPEAAVFQHADALSEKSGRVPSEGAGFSPHRDVVPAARAIWLGQRERLTL